MCRRTWFPTISRMTMIVCCQAVKELKSMVESPVPVAALTQTKRASIYSIENLPLDATNMPATAMGIRMLEGGASASVNFAIRQRRRV